MSHRWKVLAAFGLLLASLQTTACSDPQKLVPVIQALASAAPKIVDTIERIDRLRPSPTPKPPPQGLRASVPSFVLKVGDQQDLAPQLRTLEGLVPTRALEWTVSNPAVVTIEPETGRIRGASTGTAVVSVNLRGVAEATPAQFLIEVLDNPQVKGILVAPPSVSLAKGESRKLTAQVFMLDGQINGNVNWSSSDDTIATVNATTGEVSALREGRVTIVAAYSQDSRFKGLCDVTVGAAP